MEYLSVDVIELNPKYSTYDLSRRLQHHNKISILCLNATFWIETSTSLAHDSVPD
jgi:hypothetical protein